MLSPCRRLKEHGYNVVEIGVDGGGLLDMDALRQELKDGPALVSLITAGKNI